MSESAPRISVSERGPYKVEGGCTLLDAEGHPIETREGKAYFLCRCGHSQNKPFCDGSHKRNEWDSKLAERDAATGG